MRIRAITLAEHASDDVALVRGLGAEFLRSIDLIFGYDGGSEALETDVMNLKKFTLLERSLFWANDRNFVLSTNGPGAFGLIFRDGDKYLVDGDRWDERHFSFKPADIRRLPCGSSVVARDTEIVSEILKDEMERRGMIVSINHP